LKTTQESQYREGKEGKKKNPIVYTRKKRFQEGNPLNKGCIVKQENNNSRKGSPHFISLTKKEEGWERVPRRMSTQKGGGQKGTGEGSSFPSQGEAQLFSEKKPLAVQSEEK